MENDYVIKPHECAQLYQTPKQLCGPKRRQRERNWVCQSYYCIHYMHYNPLVI